MAAKGEITMFRKLYIFIAVLLIVAGCGILSIRYFVFSGLTDDITPLLPPAGQTLHPEQESFSIAVFSDFASRVDSVEKIGREISRGSAAFVLCLGDMVRKRSHPDFLHVMKELREHGVSMLTIGQYLAPSKYHIPVKRYVAPETFSKFAETAKNMGFLSCFSGPLIRSSYSAFEQALEASTLSLKKTEHPQS